MSVTVQDIESMDWFEFPGTFLIIAKRYSGKTHLLKWIMSQIYTKFHMGFIISKTAKATKEWNIIDDKYILDNDESVIEGLYNYCDLQKRKGQEKKMFLIFDDMIGFVDLKTPFMATLITTARHVGISLFFISQKMTDSIPPILRVNSDYVFIFKNANLKELKDIWEEYGSTLLEDFKQFKKWMIKNVAQYAALVVNKKTQSNDWQDIYRMIKAPEHIPQFFFKPKAKASKNSNQINHTTKPSSIHPKESTQHYSWFGPILSKYS